MNTLALSFSTYWVSAKRFIVTRIYNKRGNLIAVIGWTILSGAYLLFFVSRNELIYLPEIIIDVCSINYMVNILVQSGFIFIFFHAVSYLFYISKIAQFTRQFAKMKSLSGKQYLSSWQFWHLKDILHEHNQICFSIIIGNRQMWSRVLFVYLSMNVPANIYLFSYLLLDRKAEIYSNSLICLIIVLQFLATIIILTPVASCCKAVHGIAKYLPATQWRIGPNWMAYKLKYDDLLKNLLYGPKYAITFGAISEVTYKNTFEVCLMILLDGITEEN